MCKRPVKFLWIDISYTSSYYNNGDIVMHSLFIANERNLYRKFDIRVVPIASDSHIPTFFE